MILCVGTTPAAQRVMLFRQFVLDAVNRAFETLDGAAGKSVNVAKVLHTLGAEVVATGFFGGARGRQLEEHLKARGIQLDFITVATPTRECVTVIDQSTGQVTELVEESHPVEPEAYEKLRARVRTHAPRCQAVVMSGTVATGGPPDLYFQCARLARDAGAMVILDASGRALLESLKLQPAVVKPNRPELEATLGRKLPDDASLRAAMRELTAQGAQRVVITNGAHPALALHHDRFWNITPPRVNAVNPIGSGDAFTAGLVWALTDGADMPEACRWAAAAGAANALTPMAGEVNRADVERLLTQVQIDSAN